MQKILVVYYSQSGQLEKIVKSVTGPIEQDNAIQIDYEQLQPIEDYPFPWGKEFFNCFPESVKGIPCKLKPFKFNTETPYDLVILAYQSWFLSPSIPFNSFLQSKQAAVLLKGKKVITLHGVRNMWTCSQEIVKRKLYDLGSALIGNIVLYDRANNYIAGITIIRWLIDGKKGPSLFLPEAGVINKDITNARIFGEIICKVLKNKQFNSLQKQLLDSGAVNFKYHLMCIEKNARKIFNKFADYVLKKGGVGNHLRNNRIQLFKLYLLFMFFVVSPFVSLIFMILRYIIYPWANREILYYRGVDLKH